MNPGQSQSLSSYGNVYAPEVYNGIPPMPGVVEAPFDYIYDVVLTADQSLVDQTVSVDVDADFELRGVLIAVSSGSFSMRWNDGQGYYVQNQELLNNNFSSLTPYPSFPSLVIVAGGRIGVDITDLSSATNTVQVVFRGVKVYRPQGRR
jgi:hypothetical protein